ncbi:uncharacterized protein LOC132305101 [Cornus florida]|uniref:uncharacterized protein LOC132305101 n=1 Tax=Cornus florida TaxID=4283 RepID=UPI00289F2D09|nr:uncharacterized protein LOC132305101 [Cornus florida]
MVDFNNCLHRNGLEDLRYSGTYFTWTNSSFGCANISRKLDRVLINQAWMAVFPKATCEFLPHGWSIHFRGIKMFSVVQRLRALKGPLKTLNRKEFGAISRKVTACKEELEHCQRSLDLNPADDLLRVNERDLASKYSELCLAEEMFYKQKAQVHWLKVGDQNTAYFMRAFLSKSNKRKIVAIEDPNGTSVQGQELQNEFLRHFQELLGQSYNQYPVMNSFSDLFTKVVPSHLLSQLTAIPSDLEIKNCILSFHPYKSPGPDGFNSCFFKHTWLGDCCN